MEGVKPSAIFPFLRSCEEEIAKPITGEVRGKIPKWLKGCLIRNGPGLLEVGPDRYNHVFDGLALMHRFCFKDGSVTYQNRFLRSDSYKRNMKAKRIVTSEFATMGAPDPCKTIFQRFSSLFVSKDFTDNDLVTIVRYGNETFACSEANYIWKIDTETLDAIQKVNLQKYAPTDTAIAHAHEDTDGTVYNIGTTFGYHSYYNIIKFPPKENEEDGPFDKGSLVCKIPASRSLNPSYFHSFAMTENYFILVEQPLYLSILSMLWAQFIAGTYAEALNWDPNAHAYFYVVRRSDGQLLDTSYVATPFFVFHHINAYEEDNHLVIDLCGYEKGEIIQKLYVKALEEMFRNPNNPKEPFPTRARRYVLPLNFDKSSTDVKRNLVTLSTTKATANLQSNGSVFCDFEILTGSDPWSPELPRINYEKYNGRKYRHFYAIARNSTSDQTYLIKTNTETKKTLSWCETGALPSEPIFLPEPSPGTHDEDAGVIVASLLFQSDERKVALLVLDAKTMTEIGRVTFKTKSIIPADFHGAFIPSK